MLFFRVSQEPALRDFTKGTAISHRLVATTPPDVAPLTNFPSYKDIRPLTFFPLNSAWTSKGFL